MTADVAAFLPGLGLDLIEMDLSELVAWHAQAVRVFKLTKV